MRNVAPWPSPSDYQEAVQNPRIAFRGSELQEYMPVLNRMQLPLVFSGNFAYAFRLRHPGDGESRGVRCFRGFLADRNDRYGLIDAHLRRQRPLCLADFKYAPGGVLVHGRPLPIVNMEWIEASTLDAHIDKIVNHRSELTHLADQWVRVVRSLQRAGVAHGDLQHGNILVKGGELKLIDYDGMYVPAMGRWESCELGHEHYQHPLRTRSLFDASLDNFSALVIYLSIVALAEDPSLWALHDESLIFRRSDYLDPEHSPTLARVRDLNGQCHELALTLEAAALGAPDAVPPLLSLAEPKSKLPDWMTNAPTPRSAALPPNRASAAKAQAPQKRLPQHWLTRRLNLQYRFPTARAVALSSRRAWAAFCKPVGLASAVVSTVVTLFVAAIVIVMLAVPIPWQFLQRIVIGIAIMLLVISGLIAAGAVLWALMAGAARLVGLK